MRQTGLQSHLEDTTRAVWSHAMFFFSGCFLGPWPLRTPTVLPLSGILSLRESPERFCVPLKRRKWVKFKLWVNYPFEGLALVEEAQQIKFLQCHPKPPHTQLLQVSKGCSLFPFQTPSPASCPNRLPVSLCEMRRRLALPSGQGAAAGTNGPIPLGWDSSVSSG